MITRVLVFCTFGFDTSHGGCSIPVHSSQNATFNTINNTSLIQDIAPA